MIVVAKRWTRSDGKWWRNGVGMWKKAGWIASGQWVSLDRRFLHQACKFWVEEWRPVGSRCPDLLGSVHPFQRSSGDDWAVVNWGHLMRGSSRDEVISFKNGRPLLFLLLSLWDPLRGSARANSGSVMECFFASCSPASFPKPLSIAQRRAEMPGPFAWRLLPPLRAPKIVCMAVIPHVHSLEIIPSPPTVFVCCFKGPFFFQCSVVESHLFFHFQLYIRLLPEQ